MLIIKLIKSSQSAAYEKKLMDYVFYILLDYNILILYENGLGSKSLIILSFEINFKSCTNRPSLSLKGEISRNIVDVMEIVSKNTRFKSFVKALIL